MTSPSQLEALTDAVGALVDRAIDRVLLTGERVTSLVEAKERLRRREDTEALADNVQRVVVLATPIVRTLLRGGARLTRVPWVLVASTSVSIGLAVRNGVRELQVLAALLASRLEQASGEPVDPALVKKLAVALYLDPKRAPDLGGSRRRLMRLTRRWLLRGAFGRHSEKQARRALDAAGKLDVEAALAAWEAGRPRRTARFLPQSPDGGSDTE